LSGRNSCGVSGERVALLIWRGSLGKQEPNAS